MNQVTEFFRKLTDTSDWPPRWFCGRWTDFHGWLYICSDVAIWMAYFLIPFFLLQFVTKKNNVPLPKVFWLFGLFILLCGLTHLIDAMIFWLPIYRLSALVRFLTACVSALTVVSLFKVLPEALALKTSSEFDAELSERMKAEKKLNEYAAELESKNKEIEQFAYIVSHDMKEPLRSISNYAHILKEDYSETLDKNANQYLNAIQLASGRMGSLIKALLNFSELGENKELRFLNLSDIVNGAISDLNTLCKSTGAKIKIDSLPSLFVYEMEIRQLYMNLISNAIKFHKKDVPPEINIGSEKTGPYWKFWVSDNGIGIQAKYFEEIFTFFRRLHTSDEYEGNGIGLSNCKKIVELHKGKIWVESVFGKGTTFYFTIPELSPD